MRGAFSAVWALAIAMLAVATGTSMPASAQQADGTCGKFYRIERGDTLRGLTLRLYGHDRFSLLFGANRDILNDPAAIEAGQLLFVPCDGTGIQNRRDAMAIVGYLPTAEDQLGTKRAGDDRATGEPTLPAATVTAANERLPKPGARGRGITGDGTAAGAGNGQIAIVTPGDRARPGVDASATASASIRALPSKLLLLSADGMAPLSGSQLPGGGLVGELIRAALHEVAPSLEIETAFVNDRQAHLKVLVPLEAFTLSYPWPSPDCTQGVIPGTYSRAICKEFEFSLPIYQIELRYFARQGNPAIAQLSSMHDLQALSICRPAGFPPVDLEREEIGARIVVTDSVVACVDAMANGKADILSVPAAMFAATGVDGLVELEALRSQVPVHAIFARGSGSSAVAKDALDEGLRRIQASGAWFGTVSKYLRDFNENRLTATN